jgi:CheY-like chemotaxis protein/chemotaxis signal transduction protein
VSLPSLLLVDDSDAILALERAILSGYYSLNTASNGREALEKVGRLQPAAVLLDLSMPEMDGDEVLQKMKADPATSDIPVIIISSEKSRAESCIGMGAEAFLAKPFRAEELLAAVASAMENARRRARVGAMLVLRMVAGDQEFALPLDAVREVLLQPALRPLPGAPAYLSEYVELRLDHRVPLRERMLVIIQIEGTPLALCVDRVQDPEEFPATEIERHVGGAQHGLLQEGLIGMLRVGGNRALPLLDPKVFISRGLLRELPTMLRQGGVGQDA